MAGLNDDVEDGLPPEDALDIPTINPNQPEPDKVILTTTDNPKAVSKEPTAQDLFGAGVAPGELPNLNAEFEIIVNKSNGLKDAEEVSLGIQNSNTISQEDIKLVDCVLPGFINEDRLLGFYTKLKTKTMYSDTMKGIQQRIAKESLDLETDTESFLTKLQEEYQNFTGKFELEYQETLNKQISFIKDTLEHKVFYCNTECQKLFNESYSLAFVLDNYLTHNNVNEITNDEKLQSILSTLKTGLINSNLRSYLDSFHYKSDGSLVYVGTTITDFSLNDIIRLYQTKITTSLTSEINLELLNNTKLVVILKNTESFGEKQTKTEKLIQDYNHLFNLTKYLIVFNNGFIDFLNMFATGTART